MWKVTKVIFDLVLSTVLTVGACYGALYSVPWILNFVGFLTFAYSGPVITLALLAVLVNKETRKKVVETNYIIPRWWTVITSVAAISVLAATGHFIIATGILACLILALAFKTILINEKKKQTNIKKYNTNPPNGGWRGPVINI